MPHSLDATQAVTADSPNDPRTGRGMSRTGVVRTPRLLIASRDLAVLRGHYEDVIVALAAAGVDISIRYVHEQGLSAESFLEILRRRGATVEVNGIPRRKRDAGERFALRLRQLANLLRFQHGDFRGREWLRDERFVKAAPGPRKWATRLGRLGSRTSLLAIGAIARLDRLLPPSVEARHLIASERPDAVVAVAVIRTPEFVDLVKAAAWEGLATASWVQSWDNLSSKGLLHVAPDKVFVWNAIQREELGRYHGVPASHVCITGAQTFDHWFDGEEPSSRDDFCKANDLDPALPILLYLASSRQVETSPDDFFLGWLKAIRGSGLPALERASVVVRPHPTSVHPWLGLEHPRVAVSPVTSAVPINSPEFRRRYRDELQHASVAVALNTSGMIDAAIFGKPVCTIELPELAHVQRGTVHFEYLSTVAGGLLRSASTLDEHARILDGLIERDPYARDERSSSFVREFVRPHGIDIAPATVFANEMLRLLRTRSSLGRPGSVARTVGELVHRAAPVLGAPLEHRRPSQPGGLLWKSLKRRRKAIRRWRKTLKKKTERQRRLLLQLLRVGRTRAAWSDPGDGGHARGD
jgi:hypothetical protein